MQQDASSGAENQPSDHRDGNSGKTGQDAMLNAQVVSVAQPMGVLRQQALRSWPERQAPP